MGSFSLWHWLLVFGVVALLFGGTGKISGMMGDFAKGLKAFKSGMKEEDVVDAQPLPIPPAAMAVAAQKEPAQHSA